MQKYQRAFDDCARALQLDANNIKALRRKAVCLKFLGQLNESKLLYDQMLALPEMSKDNTLLKES